MASKRGSPVEGAGTRKVLSQSVSNPVGDSSNTSSGNPAKLRVPKGKRTVISQKVSNGQ